MKLDFSALAQPAAKARGQAGTTGTQASARVCVSPLVNPDAGTAGDKPAAVELVPDVVVAVTAVCPPLSPACPQLTDAGKLNAGGASPASPLVPAEAVQGTAVASLEREDTDGKPTGAVINTGASCHNHLLRCTCARPLEAGLIAVAGDYGLDWPHDGYGAGCPAFETDPVAPAAEERPYRLSVDEADAAHAQPWTEAQIRLYNARAAHCRSLGFTAADADDLAERLHLRDATGDERRACVECQQYDRGHCTRRRAALLVSNVVGDELAALLQRCPAHAAAFTSSLR